MVLESVLVSFFYKWLKFSQHHLLKRLSFLHCIILPPFSKIRRHKTFFFFFCLCQLCPVRVEHEGGTASWLLGTLVVPNVRGHELPLLQDLWPYWSLVLSPLYLVIRSLWPVFLHSSSHSGTERSPLHGALLCFLVCQAHRGTSLFGVLLCRWACQALKGVPWEGSYSVVQFIRHLMGHGQDSLSFSCWWVGLW